ncbi:MAG: cation:proton antiporter, partial [Myxococcaceae bacterium]|nr:cation:proton antiporter [Myxococcaceae bacterium]
MPHIPLLDEVALIAALGVIVTLVLSRLQLPAVAGLLLTGALMGPSGFGLVKSLTVIEVLAEVGVVLLLFTIGLEFSLARLASIFKQVALGGVLQVGLTTAAVVGLGVAAGQPLGRSVFLGFVFALSSTAIVLRALTERRELDAPHGRFIVGTLIFQDLCVIPMVLVVPLLSGVQGATSPALAVAVALAKAAGVVVVTVALARVVVPRLLAWVDSSRSREIFLLAVLALCTGTAWLTGTAGLSLALGAFLGGMVVADTDYGHRAMGEVMPLRDAFMSIFFVSLGMFFDVKVVLSQPLLVGVLTCGFVFGKGFLATVAAMVMRFPARVAWLAGVGLAQFGEFGFVLARLAQASGVIDEAGLAPVLSAGIISMFFTPLMVRVAPHVRAGEKLLLPLERVIGARSIDEEDAAGGHAPSGHVVIVGYGLAGQTIARALKAVGQPYLVLELNAETVRAARRRGEPVFYGDATSPEALAHAHVGDARAMVLVLNDAGAAQRIVDAVKRAAPSLPVLMRARYLAEADALKALGAQDVVAEEVEGALELLVRALRALETPRNVIDARVKDAREATHTSERKPTSPRPTVGELSMLAGLKVEPVRVEAGSSPVGRSPVELDLRRTSGALVVAVAREGGLMQGWSPTDRFQAGDV